MASAIETARSGAVLLTISPSTSAVSSSLAEASVEFGSFLASRNSSLRTASAVLAMAFATDAAVHEPPATCASGSVESPSLTVTLSSGRPSMSAVTCAMIV